MGCTFCCTFLCVVFWFYKTQIVNYVLSDENVSPGSPLY